ncbi:1-phosphatidylinositol 4,5-bisphosphate phosphodiesterase delta-1-like [Halichondria panicea]|uniref:1-phosphatidylinositol 4,5-bisphosphate phosphodiesterase delta-1-like n=1 Tax=Halichondria panicea TaxID=6063 RepID=UPI00312B96A4
MAASVISSDAVEINVIMDDDNEPSTRHPGIQSSDKHTPDKPQRLPFLSQVRSTTPRLDTPDGTRGTRGLPYIRELISSRVHRRPSAQRQPSTELAVTTPTTSRLELECIKSGKLLKTSKVRSDGDDASPAKTRRFWNRPESKFFRLTEDALEYYQTFNQVKVRRNYPLTSIEDIVYNDNEPTKFHLLFQKYEMVLEADSEGEAKNWADCIRNAWSKWNTEPEFTFTDIEVSSIPSSPQPTSPSVELLPPMPSSPGSLLEVLATDDETTIGEDLPERLRTAKSASSRSVGFKRPRAHSDTPFLRRESTECDVLTFRSSKRNNAFRLAHLTPRLDLPQAEPSFPVKSTRHLLFKAHTVVSDPESKVAVNRLHHNFAMVKYPRSTLGLPHERVFKIDNDNLQILWRRNDASAFRQKSSLKLHKVVEVREGQLTDSFNKFPYDEVEKQSLSLIFEQETKKYVRLTSIDLICDHPDNYDQWIEGLRSLVSGTKCSIYPHRYETTDPLVLWLKQIWTCKSDHHEIKMSDAVKLVQKFQPQTSFEDAKALIKISHSHQFRHTIGQADLRWDGFTLLYNLICTQGAPSFRLNELFKKYAVKYPALGLTVEELKKFLMEECFWDNAQASDNSLQSLINHHDYHHRAYKKYVAKNRPLQYQIATKLLSYAGFLSFLRSKDNAAIDLDHETLYQDMNQPLSHYFINSSHNTYLEADQLKGKSSLDAYIRALLQGCRCIEIDCWDDTFNVTGLDRKEPVIYHGYTLTSKLPFREVIHTIKDYAFRTSLYPVIISIENHCSEDQQSKMAKIFRAIMGDLLPSENLVESEARERLPSPQDLQGKILLKGSFKAGELKYGTAPRTPKMSKETSQASLSSLQANAVANPARLTSMQSSTSVLSTNSIENELPESPGSPDMNHVKAPPTSEEVDAGRSRGHSFGRGRESRRSLREVKHLVVENEMGQDDQELLYEETSKGLKKLIVYCRSISIKPWSWRKQKATSVSEMFSFGEPLAIKLCDKSQRDMLKCTERQLVRTYPKGSRFDSSNYDPVMMWNCGIQLVALNFQKPDLCMHLNQGFFRRNGACGYVLKPALMRKEDPGGATGGSAPYSPYMEVPHPDVPYIQLEIELLCGQNLCPWNKKCAQFTVEIHTYGIQHDLAKMTPAPHTETLWPQWEEGQYTLSKNIIMPELCLVYFRVEGDKKLLGQNCICLVSLQPGVKFIPMRTSGGELIPEAGLFVKIKKTEQSSQFSTSTMGKDVGLETISEDVEASLNPIRFKKYLPRQEDAQYEADPEDSFLRRTMSSPPSITGPGCSKTRKRSSEFEIEVELSPDPSEKRSASPVSLDANRVRSVTVQPSYTTPQSTEEEEAELSDSDHLMEFTLTVQGSFDEGL